MGDFGPIFFGALKVSSKALQRLWRPFSGKNTLSKVWEVLGRFSWGNLNWGVKGEILAGLETWFQGFFNGALEYILKNFPGGAPFFPPWGMGLFFFLETLVFTLRFFWGERGETRGSHRGGGPQNVGGL